MNGNQGGLDLFGESLPSGERNHSGEPSPEDFLFSQQPPTGSADAAAVLTTTTTPAFGMPLGRYSMPEPDASQPQAQKPGTAQPVKAATGRTGTAAPESGRSEAPRPAARRPIVPARRSEPVAARRERPLVYSLVLVGLVITTSLGFASWIATDFGEYVLAGLAAVMGLVGSAFTWVLSRN